ncbi:hypothetical protein LINPERPRIM_LOCUS13359 [Linum perenne]
MKTHSPFFVGFGSNGKKGRLKS